MKQFFVGVDPEDTRKNQTLPIHKKLFLKQIGFLQKHSKANQVSSYNADMVDSMQDGITPQVISDNFVDLPRAEDVDEVDETPENTSKLSLIHI